MRHQKQEQIKKNQDIIAIATIISLVKEGKFKRAIEISEQRTITPEQFGKIANMTELPATEIYKRVFV